MRSTGILAARLTAALLGLGIAFASASAQPMPMTKLATPPSISEVEGRNLDAWIKDFTSGDASVREEAIRAIVLFTGPHGKKTVDAIIARTEDRDSSVRVRACMALTIMDVEKTEIPKIVRAMGNRLVPREPQAIVRFHAAVCLLRYGEEAGDVIAELAIGSKDGSSYDTRRLCLRVLEMCGRLKDGTPDPRAINAMLGPPVPGLDLFGGCTDPTSSVRLEAVVGLGSLGRSPDPMLQERVDIALKKLLKTDRDHTVVIWAHVSQMALDGGKVTEDSLKPILLYLKPTYSARIRREAIRAIGLLGNRAKMAIPNLVEQLNDKEPTIVVAACGALGYMGADAKAALEPLEALTKQKEVHPVVKAAAEAGMMLIKGEKPAVKAP